MNTTRRVFNADLLNDPFFIGFDRVLDRVDRMHGTAEQSNYPPYNIFRVDDDNYIIEIALAGFSQSEIDVEIKDGVLTVEGKKDKESEEKNYLHKGISARQFRRKFTLSDTIVVHGADFENGILTVSLENVIPEEKKPRKINIGDGNNKAEVLNG